MPASRALPPRPGAPAAPGREWLQSSRLPALLLAPLLAAALTLLPAVTLAEPSVRLVAPAKALESARDWLKLLDAGRYDQSWIQAGAGFREGLGKVEWSRRIRSARGKLGKNVRREPIDVRRAEPADKGGPGGDCLVILFGASYEKVAYTTETLTMCREDREGREWRVAGYFIR